MKTRRFVRMFKSRFVAMVKRGSKVQTVRPLPKRMPQVGDILDAREWSGEPYRSKQRAIGEYRICEVQPVEIYEQEGCLWVNVNTNAVPADEFANADGFDDSIDMREWFRAAHGLPFTGILIGWEFDYEKR